MLPSRNGQTRPLVVDSLQLISIYSIIHSLILPAIGSAGCRDDRHLLVHISRRQRRCSLVSKCYQQPQLLINFVSISAPMFSRPNYSAVRLTCHCTYSLSCLTRLTLQCTQCNFIISNYYNYIFILLARLYTSYVQLVFVIARLK